MQRREEDDEVEEDNVQEDDDQDDNVGEDEVEDHDIVEDEVEDDDVEDGDVKGEKDDDVDVEEEEDDDVEEDEVEEEDRSGERDPTLCASLRSRNALQHFTRGTLLRKFTGKMPRPKATAHTLHEPAQSKRTSTFHKSHFIEKMPRSSPERRHTLRARPAQSKCISTFHKTEP